MNISKRIKSLRVTLDKYHQIISQLITAENSCSDHYLRNSLYEIKVIREVLNLYLSTLNVALEDDLHPTVVVSTLFPNQNSDEIIISIKDAIRSLAFNIDNLLSDCLYYPTLVDIKFNFKHSLISLWGGL